jgi:hypothetical protein
MNDRVLTWNFPYEQVWWLLDYPKIFSKKECLFIEMLNFQKVFIRDSAELEPVRTLDLTGKKTGRSQFLTLLA